jgi:putative DNA primase/helicase
VTAIFDDPSVEAEYQQAASTTKPRRRRTKRELRVGEEPFRVGAFEFGEQLANRIRDEYRWTPAYGWLCYDGARWEPVPDETMIPEVRDMIDAYAPTVIDRDGYTDGIKVLRGASSNGGIAGILKVARSVEGILTQDSQFDAPRATGRLDLPHLFPCANGQTIELFDNGTWRVRDSRPEDKVTKVGCAYDPAATAPYVEEMFQLYQPLPEVRAFIFRILAGALRGIQIQNLFVWFGEKAGNGKGTMQAVFMEVFGGYARTIPVGALLKSRGSSASNEYRDELAQLKGMRLVFADEPEEGARFSASTVSRLVGGSPIPARGMYKASTEFVPTWALFMPTNKRPRWGDHAGLERRYSETAWDYVIDRDKMTESVKQRMVAEASGVLNVLLRYWPEFCAQGPNPPTVVVEQTAEGKRQSNPVARFVSECVCRAVGVNTPNGRMYKIYTDWCVQQNEHPLTGSLFKDSLVGQGFVTKKISSNFWVDVQADLEGDF